MKRNFIDKIVEFTNPGAAMRREKARFYLDKIHNLQQNPGKRRYDAASKSRNTDGWNAGDGSANLEIIRDIRWLRNRSRDLVRNNPYAENAVRVIPNNVVGTGILPQPIVAGRSGSADSVKKAWKLWAEKISCDYDGNLTVYGIQRLVMRTVQESGECIVVRIKAKSKYKIPLRIQVLEPEYLDMNKNEPYNDTNKGLTFYGIKFNSDGERVGYWIYNKHPNEFGAISRLIDAEDVIHVYEVERPGQQRGVPFSKSTMLRMNDLDDYEFAERLRNKVAACFTAFVTEDAGTTEADGRDSYEDMQPGQIRKLNPGETVTIANPPSTGGFEQFTKAQLRGISAGNGLTYEALTNDYSNVNFSSGRMGWIEFNRNVQHLQWNLLIPKLCDRIFEWFVDAAKLAGYIPMGADVSVIWTAPRREMIDPAKETQADLVAVRAGFKSLFEKWREDGYNPEEVLKEMSEINAALKKAGLTLSSILTEPKVTVNENV